MYNSDANGGKGGQAPPAGPSNPFAADPFASEPAAEPGQSWDSAWSNAYGSANANSSSASANGSSSSWNSNAPTNPVGNNNSSDNDWWSKNNDWSKNDSWSKKSNSGAAATNSDWNSSSKNDWSGGWGSNGWNNSASSSSGYGNQDRGSKGKGKGGKANEKKQGGNEMKLQKKLDNHVPAAKAVPNNKHANNKFSYERIMQQVNEGQRALSRKQKQVLADYKKYMKQEGITPPEVPPRGSDESNPACKAIPNLHVSKGQMKRITGGKRKYGREDAAHEDNSDDDDDEADENGENGGEAGGDWQESDALNSNYDAPDAKRQKVSVTHDMNSSSSAASSSDANLGNYPESFYESVGQDPGPKVSGMSSTSDGNSSDNLGGPRMSAIPTGDEPEGAQSALEAELLAKKEAEMREMTAQIEALKAQIGGQQGN